MVLYTLFELYIDEVQLSVYHQGVFQVREVAVVRIVEKNTRKCKALTLLNDAVCAKKWNIYIGTELNDFNDISLDEVMSQWLLFYIFIT